MDPVDPTVNQDLGVLAVADLAAEHTRATAPRHRHTARQIGLILAGAEPTFRLLRWLAWRGSPPGGAHKMPNTGRDCLAL